MTIKKPEKRINVAVPENVWHKLKVFCVTRKLNMYEVTAEAIEEKMKNETENTPSA